MHSKILIKAILVGLIFFTLLDLPFIFIHKDPPIVNETKPVREVSSEEELEKIIQEKMEWAYYEGQKDAIQGRIRIEKNTDTSWIWIESPWDGGREPILTNLIDKE